jgi:hypothetical protein
MPELTYTVKTVTLDEQKVAFSGVGTSYYGVAGNGVANKQSINSLLGVARHPQRQALKITNQKSSAVDVKVGLSDASSEDHAIAIIPPGGTEYFPVRADVDLYIWGAGGTPNFSIVEFF